MGQPMTKGYWVIFVDVSDLAAFKAYQAESAPALRKYGAWFLDRGAETDVPERKARSRAVVIEFPSYEAALECFHSPEYAKAKALRTGTAVMDVAIVRGYDGPQPTETHRT